MRRGMTASKEQPAKLEVSEDSEDHHIRSITMKTPGRMFRRLGYHRGMLVDEVNWQQELQLTVEILIVATRTLGPRNTGYREIHLQSSLCDCSEHSESGNMLGPGKRNEQTIESACATGTTMPGQCDDQPQTNGPKSSCNRDQQSWRVHRIDI